MEKTDFGPSGDPVYLCAGCFYTYTKTVLAHPSTMKQFGMPKIPKIYPLEVGMVKPCTKCRFELAVGFVTCLPPEESVERERVREYGK